MVVSMTSLTVIFPAPVNVRFFAVSLIVVDALSMVNNPDVLPMVVAPEKVKSPVKVLLPDVLSNAPKLPTPVPTDVIFSAIVRPPVNDNVAPVATAVPKSSEPNALL